MYSLIGILIGVIVYAIVSKVQSVWTYNKYKK